MHHAVRHEDRTSSVYAAGQVARDVAELVGHCAGGESYLPSSVMTALTLLAVPGSRPLGTGDPGGDTERNTGSDSGSAGAVIAREITDVRWAVLTNQLSGDLTQQMIREASDGPDPPDGHDLADLRDLPRLWAAQELDLIEAADRVTAWAHLLQLGAIARLRDAVGAHCDTQLSSTAFTEIGAPYDVDREADTATADEVTLVTGLPDHETTRRLHLACATDGRTRTLLRRLHEGRTTLERCLRILDATTDCHPDDVNTITDRVLAELPDGSTPSHRLFIRRLRRQVVLHHPTPPNATPTPSPAAPRSASSSTTAPASSPSPATANASSPPSTASTPLPAPCAPAATNAPSPPYAPTSPSTSSSWAGPHPPTPSEPPGPAPRTGTTTAGTAETAKAVRTTGTARPARPTTRTTPTRTSAVSPTTCPLPRT